MTDANKREATRTETTSSNGFVSVIKKEGNYLQDSCGSVCNQLGRCKVMTAVCPVIGSIFYIIGSCFFLPQLSEFYNTGCWMFVVGIVFYLMGGIPHALSLTSGKDRKEEPPWLRIVDIGSEVGLYLSKLMYFVGSIFFLDNIGLQEAYFLYGSWLFTIASFSLCVCLLGKDIVHSRLIQHYEWHLRLMMTWSSAFSFTAAAGWGCASILYILKWSNEDEFKIDEYAGSVYIVGSLMFLASTCTNLYFVICSQRPEFYASNPANRRSVFSRWSSTTKESSLDRSFI